MAKVILLPSLRAQKLTVAFKNPWDLLAKTTLAVREHAQKNPMGSQPALMWSLLTKVRTFFDENPEWEVSPPPSPHKG
jgi:hypothetical protein